MPRGRSEARKWVMDRLWNNGVIEERGKGFFMDDKRIHHLVFRALMDSGRVVRCADSGGYVLRKRRGR
jgi:hypothetical protein